MIRNLCFLGAIAGLLAGCGPTSPGYWAEGMEEASDSMSEQAPPKDGGSGYDTGKDRFKEPISEFYDDSGLDDDAPADAIQKDASAATKEPETSE